MKSLSTSRSWPCTASCSTTCTPQKGGLGWGVVGWSGVGWGGVGWGVSMKSMGSLRGGAPHKLAGGEGSGGGGRQPSPPQEDPTIVFIHPYIQISICPYQYQFISIQSKIHNPEINDLLVKKRSTSLFGIFWSSDWYHIEIFRTHFSIRIYLA